MILTVKVVHGFLSLVLCKKIAIFFTMILTVKVVHGFLSTIFCRKSEENCEIAAKCLLSKFAVQMGLAYLPEKRLRKRPFIIILTLKVIYGFLS